MSVVYFFYLFTACAFYFVRIISSLLCIIQLLLQYQIYHFIKEFVKNEKAIKQCNFNSTQLQLKFIKNWSLKDRIKERIFQTIMVAQTKVDSGAPFFYAPQDFPLWANLYQDFIGDSWVYSC